MASRKILGVLGGMGPAATADFVKKLIELTPAARDQDHLPMIVVNDPAIPDRTEAFLTGRKDAVLEALARGVKRLEAAGADGYAIPCNSAHHWADELQSRTQLPIIHIATASLDELRLRPRRGDRIAIMATPLTLASNFYRDRIKAADLELLETPERITDLQILPAIRMVKAGEMQEATRLLNGAIDELYGLGADALLLACTELPVALSERLAVDQGLVDTTYALAKACSQWALSESLRASCYFPNTVELAATAL